MSGMPIPVETLALPVLGWYNVTIGGIQVSQILSLPNASFLSSPDGMNPGLVGTQDGAMIHLAGIADTNDGGENWIMWVADSLAVVDDVAVFNPWPSASTPGRWIVQFPQIPTSVRIITSGNTIQLTPGVRLVSIRRNPPSPVTLIMPPVALMDPGAIISVTDSNYVSSSFPITVTTAPPGDGAQLGGVNQVTDVINNNGAARTYQVDGIGWIRE